MNKNFLVSDFDLYRNEELDISSETLDIEVFN
jgi:hypothetical protein